MNRLMKQKNFLLCLSVLMVMSSCQSTKVNFGGMVEKIRTNLVSGRVSSGQILLDEVKTGKLVTPEASKSFKPFTVKNANENIVTAVLNYPSYISSKKNIVAARAFVDGTSSVKGLQASVSILGGVKSENRSTDPAATLSLSMNKLVYDYGAADFAILSAEERYEITKIESLIMAETLTLSAFEAWVALVRNKKIHEVYLRGMNLAEPLLGKIKNISSSGIADKSDLLDAQKRYSSLEVALSEVKSLLISSEVTFSEIFPGSDLNSVALLDLPELPLIDGTVLTLINNSNKIKTQRLLVKSYLSEIRALELRAKPNVSLSSTINAPAKDTLEDGVATIGVSVNYNFSDGGKRAAEIDGLKARIESLENEIQRQILDSKTKLSIAEQQLKTSLKKITSSKQIISLTKDIRDTAKGQLISGRSSISDVMNAEVSLADAEISLINAEADARLASYAIIRMVEGILSYINWSDTAS